MKSCMALVLLVCAGCAKSAPPAGKAVSIENACNEADGTRVRVTGYLRSRRGLLSFCSNYGGKKTCDLALYATAEAPPDWNPMQPRKGPELPQLKLSVPVGDSPGEMAELPEKFEDKDILVHLPGDATAAEGSKLTVDGKLSVAPAANPSQPKTCWVNVEWATP
jgi:hypothetical protein